MGEAPHVLERGGGGGGGGAEHPQLSRYFNRALTLIQQSVKNSCSLLMLKFLLQ